MGYRFSKRVLDLAGAATGLLAIAPFAPFIALAIAIDSRGPILIRLPRVSEGKIVRVWKFRSMIEDAERQKPSLTALNERDGYFFKIRRDPRITRVGRVIRRFRLDEFPQLMNVLSGDLSLVGPRPHEPAEVAGYPENYRNIAEARAGVTGLSQVSGASSLPFLRELELDQYYLKTQSVITDLGIIGKTIAILFFDPTAV